MFGHLRGDVDGPMGRPHIIPYLMTGVGQEEARQWLLKNVRLERFGDYKSSFKTTSSSDARIIQRLLEEPGSQTNGAYRKSFVFAPRRLYSFDSLKVLPNKVKAAPLRERYRVVGYVFIFIYF